MSINAPSRRELQVEDWSLLAETLRDPDQPLHICRALETVSDEVIGHRLFTVMHFDSIRSEVQRIYTNLPAAYPVGGRKQKKETAWADQVLGDMKVFRGSGAADIQSAFEDHETILGLGLGSFLNIPIVFKGRCVGTMNLLHQTDWYRHEDERVGLLLGAFLIPALLNDYS
jgi:hypothetical protein